MEELADASRIEQAQEETVAVSSRRDNIVVQVPKSIYDNRKENKQQFMDFLQQAGAAQRTNSPDMPSLNASVNRRRNNSGIVNRGMEFITSVNRAGTQTLDVLTSPAQAVVNVGAAGLRQMGFNVPGMPTLRSTVPERGAFAPDDALTKVMAGAGELATISVPSGVATRAIGSMANTAAKYGQTAFNNFLEVLGKTRAIDDVTFGLTAGAGGEALVQATGQEGGNFENVTRFSGQLITPAGWTLIANRLATTTKQILKDAAPSANVFKGASRANFAILDNAGIRADGPSVNQLKTLLNRFTDDYGIDVANGTGALATKIKNLKKAADESIVSYGFLDDTRSFLRKQPKTTTQGAYSHQLAEELDGLILTMNPVNKNALGGNTVETVIKNARELWRRGSNAKVLESIRADAEIDAISKGGGGAFIQSYKSNIAKLLKDGSKKGKYFNKEEKELLKKALSGTKFSNLLEAATVIGFNSSDLVKNVLLSGVIGVTAGAGMGAGVGAKTALIGGAGIIGLTATASALRGGARAIFRNNAKLQEAILNGGKNAEDITKAYLRNAKNKDPRDLALLLINQGVNPLELKTLFSSSAFIDDAMALAIAGNQLMMESDVVSTGEQVIDNAYGAIGL
tara:strand:- start:34 stop:1914 length:1881 start_codon:yes stop_codon:yes gene_type:complete